jgi:hypothetical protein
MTHVYKGRRLDFVTNSMQVYVCTSGSDKRIVKLFTNDAILKAQAVQFKNYLLGIRYLNI